METKEFKAPHLYTVREAAKQYGVPSETLYREIRAGRLKAILRRCEVRHWHADSELGLDRSEQTATVDGRKVRLTKLEFDLLYQLAMAGGSTVSKATLIREAWGAESMASSRALKERMRNLRKKIGGGHIVCVYGEGYRLVP